MSFLGGLVDSFTGKGARRDIDKGIGAVQAGKTAAQGYYTQGEGNAQGYIQPFLNRGGREMYDATLGLREGVAPGSRAAAQNNYFGDDVLQRQLDASLKRQGQVSNASGQGGYGARGYGPWASGQAGLAANRVMLQNYGNWQNRLAGVAGEEQNAAGTAAGISQWGAAGRAGVEQGANSALAGLYQNRAQTENALAQNIIGGIGAVGTFFGGRPAPQGGGQTYGNNISDLGSYDPYSGQRVAPNRPAGTR